MSPKGATHQTTDDKRNLKNKQSDLFEHAPFGRVFSVHVSPSQHAQYISTLALAFNRRPLACFRQIDRAIAASLLTAPASGLASPCSARSLSLKSSTGPARPCRDGSRIVTHAAADRASVTSPSSTALVSQVFVKRIMCQLRRVWGQECEPELDLANTPIHTHTQRENSDHHARTCGRLPSSTPANHKSVLLAHLHSSPRPSRTPRLDLHRRQGEREIHRG
jgi:hypothetical protein